MLATLINAAAIILGSLLGLLLRRGLPKKLESAVFAAAGISTLVIGMQMAFKTSHLLALTLSLIIGGLAGAAMDIEGAVLKLGERLKTRFARDGDENFAYGFLSSSVLYCAGAMAIVGSFKAGTEGDFSILLTKSALDGFMSIFFASALGPGVAFSALPVLLYQGILTAASVWIKPFVSDLMLAEVTGVGGALVIMIGINLLDLRKLKTGDFLPALVVMVLLVLAMPYVPFL